MNKRERIFNSTQGRCYYCGCELDFHNFHLDHIHPKNKGGKDKDNMVPACPDCNLSKGNLDIEEFRVKISNMLFSTIHGRMIAKYYKPQVHEIKFFFEGDSYD